MSDIQFDKQGPIAIITLDRPDSMNAIGLAGDAERFIDISRSINTDREIRCSIITGKGKAFSAGGDLKAMRARSGTFAGDVPTLRDNYREGIQMIVESMWNLEVPLVAALNGHAIGLGSDLACTADIRITSNRAKFGATFINIGLVPGDGGAWLLPRTIGRSRAAEMFFTGELVNAETALDWGWVSYVLEPEQVMPRALEVAEKIAAKPPLAVRMTKQMIRQSDTQSLREVMETASGMQAILHTTDDHEAAISSILSGEKAIYKGS